MHASLRLLTVKVCWITAANVADNATQARGLLEKLEADAAGIPSLRAILEAEA